MYSKIDEKKKSKNPYSLTMNIIYNPRHYRNIQKEKPIILDRFDKHRIVFKKMLDNDNNKNMRRLKNEKEKIEYQNKRNKIEYFIDKIYDKYNKNIRNYNDNLSSNKPKKIYEKIRCLTKEKIKDQIISKSNQFHSKEYEMINKDISPIIFKSDNKKDNYRNIYKIKYIDNGVKKDEYIINQKEGDFKFSKIEFYYMKPLNKNKKIK